MEKTIWARLWQRLNSFIYKIPWPFLVKYSLDLADLLFFTEQNTDKYKKMAIVYFWNSPTFRLCIPCILYPGKLHEPKSKKSKNILSLIKVGKIIISTLLITIDIWTTQNSNISNLINNLYYFSNHNIYNFKEKGELFKLIGKVLWQGDVLNTRNKKREKDMLWS